MNGVPTLVALLSGRVVGHVQQNLQGKLRFTYELAWQDWPGAYPLSLSMPLAQREHGDEKIRPYLEGLLPDNDWILRRWGTQFHGPRATRSRCWGTWARTARAPCSSAAPVALPSC